MECQGGGTREQHRKCEAVREQTQGRSVRVQQRKRRECKGEGAREKTGSVRVRVQGSKQRECDGDGWGYVLLRV